MNAFDHLLNVFSESGGDRTALADPETVHLAVEGHRIVSGRTVEGVLVDARETHAGISAEVRVLQGVRLKNPVHLCFGILHKKGSQEIRMEVILERNAEANFIAHCIFPDAERVVHKMDAVVEVGEGAVMRYSETHFHGQAGGVEALPTAQVTVGHNGRYCADFNLISGRVGRLNIDYTVIAAENGIAELTARVFGYGDDKIGIKEKVVLAGNHARGLIKTRVALENEASAEVTGITEGNAAGARGHVDCMEIVKDNAVARAIPIVKVTHPQAKVTHEAAIGSVDKHQLETLMAHGLTSEEAVGMIVKGILR